MDNAQFQEISSKLDTIIKLLSISSLEGKDPKTQVLILSSFGLQPKQIAHILGKTPNSVRIMLHRARKETKAEAEVAHEAGSSDDRTN